MGNSIEEEFGPFSGRVYDAVFSFERGVGGIEFKRDPDTLRLALPKPKSGERLLRESECLAQSAGFEVSARQDLPEIFRLRDRAGTVENVEMTYYRPEDALKLMDEQALDLAVVGRHKFLEYKAANPQSRISQKATLPFGGCSLCFAAADSISEYILREKDLGIASRLTGRPLVVATSYPSLVKEWAKSNNISNYIKVFTMKGGVERAIPMGVADLIFDVVQSGKTLNNNGLSVIFGSVVESSAIIVTRGNLSYDKAIRADAIAKRMVANSATECSDVSAASLVA